MPPAHAGASVFADFRRNPSKDLPDFDFEWAGADGAEVVGKARDTSADVGSRAALLKADHES